MRQGMIGVCLTPTWGKIEIALCRRREYEPLMLNGGAHHSFEVEAELRIRPLPIFQRLERAEYSTDEPHHSLR